MTQPATPTTPHRYWIGWNDIQQYGPGGQGPYGYTELVPGSGTFVPNPETNQLHPGFFPANKMPNDPIDLSTMKRLPPGALGPYGYKELVPGSGTWVVDSRIRGPGESSFKAKAPLDLADIQRLPPGALGPYGHTELVPGSGLWVPDPDMSEPPHATKPSALHKDDADGDKPLDLDYRQLEKLAKEHDLNAKQLLDWAKHDPNFAERYLQTHGLVNYPTYLKIKSYMDTHVSAATAYSARQSETATKLRNYVTTIRGIDESNAANVVKGAKPA